MKSRLLMLAAATLLAGGCTVVPAEPEVAAPPPAPVATAPEPAPAAPAGSPAVATTGTNRWYKDQYNRCYRVNEQGDRVYDPARQC